MLSKDQQLLYTLGRSGTRQANVRVLSPGVSSVPPETGLWWDGATLTARFTATTTGVYTIVIDPDRDETDTYHVISMTL
jgi:hypothetical protein